MKYPCELIRDLIPLKSDGVCSEASKKAVEEHLAECESCRKYLGLGEKETSVFPETRERASYGKRMLRNVKSLYFVLGGIGFLMLAGWIVFLLIAVMNPQLGVLGSLGVTYVIYSVYIVCMCGLIAMSCVLRPKNIFSNGKLKPHGVFFALSWLSFALWWIAFFIHNLFGWDSPSALLRRFDAVAAVFFFGWLILLAVGAACFFVDLAKTKKRK